MRLLYCILVSTIFLASTEISSARKPKLPGKTLRNVKADGQPAHNPQNVVQKAVTPACPFIGMSLRDLLNYARAHHTSIFRQAVKLRRSGLTQAETRDWLEATICEAEGF